ncbi:1-acylglycerol-3-phosphate acyltransferase [Phyllosticta capitalensis]|uniref:1-acylglycerol-3-phosphate acyltransferase n=2 Tax=Phyllosticta capitalensis TaxID=121624 RepID=A0ABR1Z033_9PEZI
MAAKPPLFSAPLRALRAVALVLPWLAYLLLVDALLSLLLPFKLFAPTAVFNASSVLAESVWAWIQAIFTRFNRARILVSANCQLPRAESAIVISNHVAWSDFYMIQQLASQQGMLGRCRWFAKRSLRWVPFLGWGLWAMGMPLVSRRWTTDRVELDKVFRGIITRRWPIWLISYSEGTRFTSAAHAAAVAYSKSHSRPAPIHTLLPRPKGFVAAVTALRAAPQVRAVYDVTIAYAKAGSPLRFQAAGAPSFWQTLVTPDFFGSGWRTFVHVDRFEVNQLPEDEEGLAAWLDGRWVAKGQRLEGLREGLAKGESWVDKEGLGGVVVGN